MRTQHIPMTIEEYRSRPFRIGWKEEYWDGAAHICPSSRVAILSMPVCAKTAVPPLPLRDIVPADETALIETYYEAFWDTCEYCDYSEEDMRKAARDSIRGFFAGRHGETLPASRIVVDPAAPDKIVGAALLVRNNMGPTLDLLFVRPDYHRHGLATALVSAAMNALFADGEQTLYSGYHLANEPSITWHTRFGFTELPDLTNAQTRLRMAHWEQESGRQNSQLSSSERETLEQNVRIWQAEVELLEEICEREGFEAVTPLMRLRSR